MLSEGKLVKWIKDKMFDMDELRFKDLPMTLTRRKIAEDMNHEYKELLELVDVARKGFPQPDTPDNLEWALAVRDRERTHWFKEYFGKPKKE